jgi:hypothetical protein
MDQDIQEVEVYLSKEEFKATLPKAMRGRINDEVMGNINVLLQDQSTRVELRDNLVGYASVLAQGRYKVEDYVSAVKYVSYKMLGSSNLESYVKTFPARYQRLLDDGVDNHRVSAYASAYNKNQLVNKIYEQTLIPSHILNADMFQSALNVQATLMVNANSEKVRSDAANSLLTHLKSPEVNKIELDISVKEDKTIDDLRQATMALAASQRDMIQSGMMNAKEVAHSQIIEGEVVE